MASSEKGGSVDKEARRQMPAVLVVAAPSDEKHAATVCWPSCGSLLHDRALSRG